MKIFLVFVILLIGVASAEAATYWASPSHSYMTQNCINSATQPVLSQMSGLGGGQLCLNPGDTLYLTGGNYGNAGSGQGIFTMLALNGTTCFRGVDGSSSSPCMNKGTSSQRITISGAPGQTAILQSSGTANIQFYGAVDYITIKDLTLEGNRDIIGVVSTHRGVDVTCSWDGINKTNCDNSGSHAYPTGLIFDNLIIRNYSQSGILGFGQNWEKHPSLIGNYNIIRNSYIHHNGADITRDHGIYVQGQGVIIENNTITHNADFGVQLHSEPPAEGGDPTGGNHDIIVRNNMFVDNGVAAIVTESGPNQIYNNVSRNTGGPSVMGNVPNKHWQTTYTLATLFANNTAVSEVGGQSCFFAHETTNNEFINNLCVGTSTLYDTSQGTNTSPNNFVTNLQTATSPSSIFVSPSTNNFQLLSSAGASIINAGTSVATVFSTDARGTSRPQPTGGQWDLGACEWFNVAGVCPSTATVTPPADQATVALTSPVTGSRYITTSSTLIAQGTASCTTGTPTVIWVNNLGGSGTMSGTTTWSMTGSGAALTPNQINQITITNNCSGGGPSAQLLLRVAYSPAQLLGAWAFDETVGTAPQDSSGNANHGTFGAGVAITTTAQKYGAAGLDFSTGSVTVNSSQIRSRIIGGFSFIGWVNPDVVSTDWTAIAVSNYSAFFYATTPGSPIECPVSTLTVGFVTGDNPTQSTVVLCAPQPLPINQYSCVAGTYNGSTMKLYINKIEVASKNLAHEFPVAATGNFQISNSQFTEPFDGKSDEWRFAQYGLSAGEVATYCDTQIGGAPPAAASSLKIGSVGVKIGNKDVRLGF